ncbi:unnamed protein product [Amoebophrya sp. A25]|nr:unnamed protein product [Amoebophrya sp. A25]|eukprot:GSA25T00002157001.1
MTDSDHYHPLVFPEIIKYIAAQEKRKQSQLYRNSSPNSSRRVLLFPTASLSMDMSFGFVECHLS